MLSGGTESTRLCVDSPTVQKDFPQHGAKLVIAEPIRPRDSSDVQGPETRSEGIALLTWSNIKKLAVFLQPLLVVVILDLLKTLGTNLVAPDIPFLMIEYFTKQNGFNYVEASKQAVQVKSTLDSTRAMIALFFVPVYGKLIDSVGRKPWFVVNAILFALPNAFLYAFPHNPLWYTAMSQLAQLVTSAYSFAFLVDQYDEKYRGAVFAVSTGFTFVAGIPTVAFASIPFEKRLVAAIILVLLRIPFATFFVWESLPAAQRKLLSCSQVSINPLPVMKLVLQNRLMRALTLLVGILLLSGIGPGEVGQYYLIDKVGATKRDMFILTTELGVILPVSLMVLYPILSKFLKPHRIVVICFIFVMLQNLGFMVITQPWQLLGIVIPLSLGTEIGVPAIISMFSNAGEQEQQGSRLAGLLAIMDIIKAIGPLAAGQAFVHLPQNKQWTLYLIAAVILLPGVFLSFLWLPRVVKQDQEEKVEQIDSWNVAGHEEFNQDPRPAFDEVEKNHENCGFDAGARWEDAVSLISEESH